MDYGLWNLPTGFWPGTNAPATPQEMVGRTFYTTNTIQPTPTSTIYHGATVPPDVSSFPSSNPVPLCRQTLRTQADYLANLKNNILPRGNLGIPMTNMPDIRAQQMSQQLQQQQQQQMHMNTDMLIEQSSMESVSSTVSSSHQLPLQTMLTEQPTEIPPLADSPLPANKKKIKRKTVESPDESDWDQSETHTNSGDGTNMPIKSENNGTPMEYLQHGYQQQMYNMVFNRISANRKEMDETEDEEDDETDIQPNQGGNFGSSMQNRSPEEDGNPSSGTQRTSGYECGECGLVADTRPGLKKHISLSHPAPNPDPNLTNALLKKISTSSACPMASCRFRTSERDEMEAHVARHVAEGFNPNGKKRNGPISLQRVRYEREEYRCQMCAYSCTIEKAFYKHLKNHSVGHQTNQIKISCVICGKDRATEVDMNRHMKKHRENRYFCCDICIFKTVQLKKLIQHRRMHTGEKPHLCPHCAYRSARRDNLRSHVRRVHKKENLYCDTFSPRGLLLTASVPSQEPTSPTPSQPELKSE